MISVKNASRLCNKYYRVLIPNYLKFKAILFIKRVVKIDQEDLSLNKILLLYNSLLYSSVD